MMRGGFQRTSVRTDFGVRRTVKSGEESMIYKQRDRECGMGCKQPVFAVRVIKHKVEMVTELRTDNEWLID